MKKLTFIFSVLIIIISSSHCNTLTLYNLDEIIDKYIRFNNWKDARTQLEVYIKENPVDSSGFRWYAVVLGELGLYDEAILATRTSINYEQSSEKKGELYNQIGYYYYCKNLGNMALEMYNKSIELKKNIDSSYYMMGTIYYENKDYEKALDNWKKYVTVTNNIEKKVKLQEIISKFEQKLSEEKIKKEEEQKLKDEFLKNLMDELGKDKTDSKSLEADKNKTKKSDVDFEDID